MYCQVAHVTKEDDVAVLALAIHADAAHGILIDGRHATVTPSAALSLATTK